jgi:sterol desaturase/sphingolipid hydroxylase (fatty acid hydroxylase superfamily)
METMAHHSGYDFPWSMFTLVPGLQGSAEEHDLHHSVNTGNFGSFWTWWDRACGTQVVVKD